MVAMIARPGLSDRVFPPVEPDLYRPDAPEGPRPDGDHAIARNLVTLSSRPISRFQQLSGWGLDAPRCLGRALWLHREAIKAERECRWQRADFLWTASREAVLGLLKATSAWRSVLTAAGLGADECRPEALDHWKRRMVDELFIDVHCAFYNGRVQSAGPLPPDDRGFEHVRMIKAWLPFSDLSGEGLRAVLDPPGQARAQASQEAGRWEEAVREIADLQRQFPTRPEYVDQLVSLRYKEALSSLGRGDVAGRSRVEARSLRRSIELLDGLRRQFPYQAEVYEALGHLHSLSATRLAEADMPSESLLAARHALALGGTPSKALRVAERALSRIPGKKEAESTLLQAHLLFGDLGTRVRDLERVQPPNPYAWLFADGEPRGDESSGGPALAPTPSASGASSGIDSLHRVARARKVWRAVGLPTPPDWFDAPDRFDKRAVALVTGLSRVFREVQGDPGKLAAAWDAVAAEDEDLRSLDPAVVLAFLRSRLPGGDTAERPAPPAAEPDEPPPVLVPNSAEQRPSGAPFGLWLFSRRDVRLKLQAAAALALLASGLWLTRVEALRREEQARIERRDTLARERALRQIEGGQAARNNLDVIRGAEAYLALPPPKADTADTERVLKLYDEAIVRWFIGRGEPVDDEAKARLARYQSLVQATRQRKRS